MSQEEFSRHFKSLCYADMVINKVYTNDPFNNKWRTSLTEEDKKFFVEFASKLASIDRDKT